MVAQTLDVSVSGAGHVKSDPAGIDCPKACASPFKDGDTVTLTATADAGWKFSSWSGDCSGAKTCVLKMDTKHGVGATFDQPQGPGPPPDLRFKVSSSAPAATTTKSAPAPAGRTPTTG
jgi:hypothetical protein